MNILLQVAYYLASQPVVCSDGVDAASDPTEVSAPISALLLVPVWVLGCSESSPTGREVISCSMQPLSPECQLQGLVVLWLAGLTAACPRPGAPGPPQTPHSIIHRRGQWPQLLSVMPLER